MMASVTRKSAIISVGRIYCDLVFTGLDAMPILGRETFANDMEMVAGGGAFIAAAHFAHIGRDVALLARLGTDTFSSAIGKQMGDHRIDLQFLEHAADAGPQVTVATVVGHDRAFLTHRAGPARPSTLNAAFAWEKACHLHIAEFATLNEIPDLVARAKNGLTVSLDPSWDASLIYSKGLVAACDGVDVFLPNLEEAEAITGKADPREAIDALSSAFPVVALKGGAQGHGCHRIAMFSTRPPATFRSSTRPAPVTLSMLASLTPGSAVKARNNALKPASRPAASLFRPWEAHRGSIARPDCLTAYSPRGKR